MLATILSILMVAGCWLLAGIAERILRKTLDKLAER